MANEIQDYINSVYNNSHLNPMKKKLIENNYHRFITEQHTLLDDELWVHEDTIKAYINNTRNPKYIFVFKDKFLNEWSSTQTMRRKSKLSKSDIKFLEETGIIDEINYKLTYRGK